MTMRTRKRFRAPLTQIGAYHHWELEDSPLSHAEYACLDYLSDEVRDENHGWNWRRKPGNQGGPFYRWKVESSRSPSGFVTLYRPNGLGSNRGKLYTGRLTIAPEPVPPFQDAQNFAEQNSATLWNRAKPAKPLMNGAAAIYELRELPSMLKQRFVDGKRPLKSIADYHLALQFGWKPLLQDVRAFVDAHFNGKKYLDQLIRDEGKPVRRKAGMPAVRDDYGVSQFEGYQYFEQRFVTQAYASVPVANFHWTRGVDCWFEGRFRYWLPPGPRDWRWKQYMLETIFGLYPTPSQVYQVIPWSWLVDWFTNVGDVVDNMSGGVEDRLSADYAYVMCHAWYQRDAKVRGEFWGSNSFESQPIEVTASSRMLTSTKVRIEANPFGFGIKDGNLSPMQWSILGALGLSSTKPVRF